MIMMDWLQKKIAAEQALTSEQRVRNEMSHTYGVVDDCIRCFDCEILPTNGWKEYCCGH